MCPVYSRQSRGLVASEAMLDLSVLAQRHIGPVGVAVSGGGDSVAMLLSLSDWAQAHDIDLTVATVDHGLRDESAAEAAWVGDLCRRLGLSHRTLLWARDADASGNLAEQARDARRVMLANWIAQQGGQTVLLGHTQDDVAETFLMRLARGSGLDGLSAMRPVHDREGVRWLRPLLNASRDDLRHYLRDRGQAWHDDPTNKDDSYTRARTRKALAVLRDLDIDSQRIARTAHRLSLNRDVLVRTTDQLATSCLHQSKFGELVLSNATFRSAPEVLQERLLQQILQHFTGPTHPPRHTSIARLRSEITRGASMTLAGVQMRWTNAASYFCREASALPARANLSRASTLWDHRWTVAGWGNSGSQIGPLGTEGLRQCGSRPRGLRASVAVGLPALWEGPKLVAAPFLLPYDGVVFRLRRFGVGAPH